MRFQLQSRTRQSAAADAGALRVLRAARRLFLRTGGSGFSARGVAREAALSLGAVQHFYPTRAALLAAMLEFVVNEYDAAYAALFARLPLDGEARLLRLVDWLIEDSWRPPTRQFFLGFWALGCHDANAARMLDRAYAHHCANLAGFVKAARPGLADSRCHALALQLAALIEGLTVLGGLGAQRRRRGAIRAAARATVLRLIGPDAAGVSGRSGE
jgi:AcrR family transcriptional regulator